MTVAQIVVDLENEPGRLFTVTDAIAAADLNLHALTVTGDHTRGQARMLVDDAKRARAILMALDVPARTEEVFVVALPDSPGALRSVLRPIVEASINLLYVDAFSEVDGRAIAIFRCNDAPAAARILADSGHQTLDLNQIFAQSASSEERA